MNGLFEDDANVRPQPKKKAAKKLKLKPKKEKGVSVGRRLVAKAESKATLVTMASGSGGDFADVDITKAKRASATKRKVDRGLITPPINYISDEVENG